VRRVKLARRLKQIGCSYNFATLFALLGVIAVVQIWRNNQWRKGVRWVGTVAVIAAVVFAGELWLWNLLGYQL